MKSLAIAFPFSYGQTLEDACEYIMDELKKIPEKCEIVTISQHFAHIEKEELPVWTVLILYRMKGGD